MARKQSHPCLQGQSILSILTNMGRREFPWVIFVLFCFLLCAPIVFALAIPSQVYVFNGFLQNPTDGFSYLAKMQQGISGSWTFQLPFTTLQHQGQPLFLYYLFLGHLSALFSIPPEVLFHVVRILNGVILFGSAWFVLPKIIQLDRVALNWVIAILFLGGGMGWLFLPFGWIPGDFWVAEIFPFLASFTNPHFPLSIACMVWMVFAWTSMNSKWRYGVLGLGGLILAITQPFGNVILGIAFFADILWLIYRKQQTRSQIIGLVIFMIACLPYMLYSLWIIRTNPIFSIWNNQNITESASILDYVFTISPGIFLAGYCIYLVIKKRIQVNRILIIWVIVSVGLSFLPLSLQRRYLLGVHIPITLLGVSAVEQLLQNRPKIGKALRNGWLGLVIPTNLILLTMSFFGIQTRNPSLYLQRDEISGFLWLKGNAGSIANVLTGPETGLYIPAYTGLGVVYGHPFETPNAEANKSAVLDCLMKGKMAICDEIIQKQSINYILIGPREQAAGWSTPRFQYPVVFQSGQLTIYEVVK